MNRIFRLKAHLRAARVSPEMTYLLGEDARIGLFGAVFAKLVPLLDGQQSVATLAKRLVGEVSMAEILYALERLTRDGLVTQVGDAEAPDASRGRDAWWEARGSTRQASEQHLREHPVTVEAVAGLDTAALRQALTTAGFSLESDAALRVVLTPDYQLSAVATLASLARRRGHDVLLVKPVGLTPWVGPLLRAERGPCLECLSARLAANHPVEQFAAQHLGFVPAPAAAHPAGEQIALSWAAQWLLNWICPSAGESPVAERAGADLVSLDLASMNIVHHRVDKRPQCAGCGDADLMARRAEQPVRLAASPKQFVADGGHRALSPEQSWQRFRHLVSPLTGVVASLGPMPGGEHPMRQVYGGAYYVRPTFAAPDLSEFSRVSSGKGRSPAQATMSALAEAIERYSAVFQGDEPRRRASLRELGDDAIHPNELLNFSERQYDSAAAVNATTRDYRRAIPHRIDPDQALDWTPVWSLTNECMRYAPTAYCYSYVPTPAAEVVCYTNPNGHAAGNCLAEAILQACMELVERDAVAIWWYNRLPRPGVDLSGFGRPWLHELQTHYAELGWELWVLDLTTDLGIPVFSALARHRQSGRFCIGFGAHFDAGLAVQRALTELNQIHQLDGAGREPWDAALVGEQPYLFPDATQAKRDQRSFRQHPSYDDLADDVRACVRLLAAAGLEMLVLDQTRPDIGLNVAKVIVPGLRHFWPRFGPGRLYDVPVRMGALSRALSEEQLHPEPIYL